MLRRITVEPWAAIDREFVEADRPRAYAAWVLVVAAVALTLERYFGGAGGTGRAPEYARAALSWIPYSALRPRVYWSAFKLLTGIVLPWLCIRLVLRSTMREHGWTLRGEGRGLRLALLIIVALLPVVVVASFTQRFQYTYPLYSGASRSSVHLSAWLLAYGFQFVALEFFYRGFLLFALARQMGSTAIFVMVVPYAMLHFGKPLPEVFGSILAGIALGTLALRTRSIAGGVLVHCGVAFSMDLLALAHKGQLARLVWGE